MGGKFARKRGQREEKIQTKGIVRQRCTGLKVR